MLLNPRIYTTWCIPCCSKLVFNPTWCIPGRSNFVLYTTWCIPCCSILVVCNPWCIPCCSILVFYSTWCIPCCSKLIFYHTWCIPGCQSSYFIGLGESWVAQSSYFTMGHPMLFKKASEGKEGQQHNDSWRQLPAGPYGPVLSRFFGLVRSGLVGTGQHSWPPGSFC